MILPTVAIVISALAFLTSAKPLSPRTSRLGNKPRSNYEYIPNRARRGDFDAISKAYKGIDWNHAYDHCQPMVLDIIIESTRTALDVVTYKTKSSDRWWLSAAFNRYFVWSKRADRGFGWTDVQSMPLEDSQGTVRNQKGLESPTNSSIYVWMKVHDVGNGSMGYGLVARKLIQPGQVRASTVTTCTKQTYEGTVIHEWMHADIVSNYVVRIVDVVDALVVGGNNQTVYGEPACHKYSLKHFPAPDSWKRSVNTKTMQNGTWTEDGSQLKRSPDNDGLSPVTTMPAQPLADDGDSGPDTNKVDVKDLAADKDIPFPVNCHQNGLDDEGTPMYYCDYMGEDYKSFVVDSKQPFWSDDGCQLSQECNFSVGIGAVNPKCVCTCAGKPTAISDPKCSGFTGSLPTSAHKLSI
ncbi:hypothetical protein B0J14DRAFT_554982 [Halenospora varia]|nr:hypothetical protein B0J14DRAFT_554982 [Halenospora varia]